MLIRVDGSQAGTLGGGCVEAEVRQLALRALADANGQPQLHTFILDDDYGWDDGLICGGRMTILADPLRPETNEYYAAMEKLVAGGGGWTELVALSNNRAGLRPGGRSLFAAGALVASLDGPRVRLSASEGMAVLHTHPRLRLLIVGGGHVGRAVAQLAHNVDFDVWVLDDRDSCVSQSRFPHASRRIVGDVGRTLASLQSEITPATFALIVTRGHNHDEEALYHLAPSSAGYVGMIGSKRKVALIFDDLRQKGVTDAALARVNAPVGLNIGSQTVPEIAVSIVAELIAKRSAIRA